jgi:hypothetical protein
LPPKDPAHQPIYEQLQKLGFQHETDARRLVHPRTCGALRLQLGMR